MTPPSLTSGHSALDIWRSLVVAGLAASSTALGATGYRWATEGDSSLRLLFLAGLALCSAISLLVLSRRRPTWAGALGAACMIVLIARLLQTPADQPVHEIVIGWAFALLALSGTCVDWPRPRALVQPSGVFTE